jgi:hypothetical protein
MEHKYVGFGTSPDMGINSKEKKVVDKKNESVAGKGNVKEIVRMVKS